MQRLTASRNPCNILTEGNMCIAGGLEIGDFLAIGIHLQWHKSPNMRDGEKILSRLHTVSPTYFFGCRAPRE